MDLCKCGTAYVETKVIKNVVLVITGKNTTKRKKTQSHDGTSFIANYFPPSKQAFSAIQKLLRTQTCVFCRSWARKWLNVRRRCWARNRWDIEKLRGRSENTAALPIGRWRHRRTWNWGKKCVWDSPWGRAAPTAGLLQNLVWLVFRSCSNVVEMAL